MSVKEQCGDATIWKMMDTIEANIDVVVDRKLVRGVTVIPQGRTTKWSIGVLYRSPLPHLGCRSKATSQEQIILNTG